VLAAAVAPSVRGPAAPAHSARASPPFPLPQRLRRADASRWRRADAQSVRRPPLLRPTLGAQASSSELSPGTSTKQVRASLLFRSCCPKSSTQTLAICSLILNRVPKPYLSVLGSYLIHTDFFDFLLARRIGFTCVQPCLLLDLACAACGLCSFLSIREQFSFLIIFPLVFMLCFCFFLFPLFFLLVSEYDFSYGSR